MKIILLAVVLRFVITCIGQFIIQNIETQMCIIIIVFRRIRSFRISNQLILGGCSKMLRVDALQLLRRSRAPLLFILTLHNNRILFIICYFLRVSFHALKIIFPHIAWGDIICWVILANIESNHIRFLRGVSYVTLVIIKIRWRWIIAFQ